MFIGNF
jgi:hypothetical protein